MEIDPEKAMQEYKKKITPQIENVAMLKGTGLEDAFDLAGMTPGIDEVAAFDKFLHYMNSDDYDVVIFDTAPTGHALRFLSFPDVLDTWLGKIIRLRLRFAGLIGTIKSVLPFGDKKPDNDFGAKELEEMKKRIDQARKIMSDPKRTHYNLVIIPETLSIMESERSLKVLDEYKIPTEKVIVNMLLPPNPGCGFCTERRKQQQERLKIIKKKFSDYKIIEMHLSKNEIHGLPMLNRVSQTVFG